jgi:hypothetical protein
VTVLNASVVREVRKILSAREILRFGDGSGLSGGRKKQC